ncbi:MAG: malate synthase A [Trueperaceae bacterium]|nr:malate synthase A [Trueperaceae bacterium]
MPDITLTTDLKPEYEAILTPDALQFAAKLHLALKDRRASLLAKREERQAFFDAGGLPDFLPETAAIRETEWKVAPAPADLNDRRVEITGPLDRKMMINALNSGAKVFMADAEDSMSPNWDNVMQGQLNLRDAVRKTIGFVDEDRGKTYALNDKDIATLLLRPRGWHLNEKHVLVDGEEISGGIFDFALYMYHNAKYLLENGSGPYFYLPKLESHLEARLWNDAFVLAQTELGLPQGSIRATVLIETILAAFEMDEILYELREHMSGLNAGRWDYIFNFIKKLRNHSDKTLPDRAQVTMTVPFMRAYAELLVKTCHRRGAHAIGGMAAFIPSRRDEEVNKKAFSNVLADKRREASQGYDGTWVAHPDLVPVAKQAFDEVLGDKPNQKDNLRTDLEVGQADLLNTRFDSSITEGGVRMNIDVGIQYLNSWLNGNGAAAIYNLMEDAATAEISRAQLWQWIKNGSTLDDGRSVSTEMYKEIRDEELARLKAEYGESRFDEAADIMNQLILTDDFISFLTLPAYEHI